AWNWYLPLAEQATLEPGTHETLQRLRDGGYRMGLISNTFVPGFVLDRHLARLSLLEYFPVRVYSCDVGYRKPDPRIFQIALDRIGVGPDEAVFIGDSPTADILGARQASIYPIWKRPPHQAGTTLDALTISRLAELPGD